MNNLPRLPFADWIDNGVDWLVTTFGTVFDGISDVLAGIVEGSVEGLNMVPSILLAVLFSLLAWLISTRRIALFSLIGLLFIDYLGYWYPMLQMLALGSYFCHDSDCDWYSTWYLGFTTSNST